MPSAGRLLGSDQHRYDDQTVHGSPLRWEQRARIPVQPELLNEVIAKSDPKSGGR
jgi:hypothetical protein